MNVEPISGWVFYLTRVKNEENYLRNKNESNYYPRSKDGSNFRPCVIFIDMEIKISEDKLNYLKDIVFDGLDVDKYDSFQSRSITLHYIEFLTPGTRQNVISRYYPELVLIVVNDEKFYELISMYVGSHKFYDLIKDDIIKRIFKVYTDRFKKRFPNDIWNIKYMSDEQFNKK